MKKLTCTFIGLVLVIVSFFLAGTCFVKAETVETDDILIDASNFPDDAFREYVRQYDKDHDGKFSKNELEVVVSVDIHNNSDIRNMAGIQLFHALKEVNCSYVYSLESLDFKNCTSLMTLNCSYNEYLETIIVSGCSSLREVNCSHNNWMLRNLDFKDCTSLMTLNCSDNMYLETIIVSGCSSLRTLNCSCCDNLIRLDINACTALEELNCEGTGISQLDLNCASSLRKLDCSRCNNLTQLDLSSCTALEELFCRYDEISQLDLSSASSLRELDCSYCNNLIQLDLSSCTALEELYCGNSEISRLDLSSASSLRKLNCHNCDNLIQLDIKNCTVLEELDCSLTGISQLDFSSCTALEELYCEYSEISRLDLSSASSLRKLSCYNCDNLIQLDISSCTALEELYCGGSEISQLDLSRNTVLTKLNCRDNNLTQLDVSKCPKLLQLVQDSASYLSDDWSTGYWEKDNRFLATDADVRIYPVSVLSLHLECHLWTLAEGSDLSLIPCFVPSQAYNRECTWSSDNTDVATVDEKGTVSGVATGTARITVTSADGGQTDTCLVYVTEDGGIAINDDHFPDKAFREYVNQYDTDKSNSLSKTEIDIVDSMDVSGKGIQSLQGIEFFTGIRTLDCSDNQLTQLDFSGFASLRGLNCSDNEQLSQLNVDKSLVERLYCSNTGFKQLSFSGYAALTDLGCSKNKQLTRLDVSNCPALRLMDSSGNNKLNSIIVSNCEQLYKLHCDHNNLTNLIIRDCPNILELLCDRNKLDYVYLSNCLSIKDLRSRIPYEGGYEAASYYRVEDGVAYWNFRVGGCNTLVVADESVDFVEYICIPVDDEHFPDDHFREYIRQYDRNSDGNLCAEELVKIKALYVNNRDITSLKGIEFFTKLTVLHCYDNRISSVDLTALEDLEELDCGENPIKVLDVSNNTKLTTLICGNTFLTTIDLSNNPSLTRLVSEQYCYGWNELTSISVSSCPALNKLVKETEYADSVIQGHPYLYNHMLHGWWTKNDDGTLSSYLFVGPDAEVKTDEGVYISNRKKPEAKEKIEAFIKRCYNIILSREPDAGGLQTWINELNSGRKSAAEIIDRFVNSPEYLNKNYYYDDSVEILYKAMLGRGSDPSGKANWVGKLENGQPFAAVINGFCVSPEFKGICDSYGINPGSVTIPGQPTTADEKIKAFVQRCYWIILNREPDEGGMNTWFNELKSRRKAASEIIDRFVNSPEFQGKNYSKADAVEILYNAMLGRDSDAAGKANWINKLDAGQPFAVVINGFCVSREFTGICESYGIKPGSVTITPLSGVAEEEALSMLAYKAKAPITKKSETNPTRVEIINPSDTIDLNIGTAVQAVYINEEKAKEFISRCYQCILGREASAAELDNWIGQMTNGTKTPDQIARGFLFSNEFKGKNVSNEDLVKMLYKVYMNRDADPEGLKTWTEKLDNGISLNDLLNTFSKTSEFKKAVSEMSK